MGKTPLLLISYLQQLGSFSFPPTSDELQFFSVTSGFTRLIMKTRYVCHGLISLYVNFQNNRTMWSTNLLVKICRWGGGGGGGRKKSQQLLSTLVKSMCRSRSSDHRVSRSYQSNYLLTLETKSHMCFYPKFFHFLKNTHAMCNKKLNTSQLKICW